jgi:hypothetical protein
VGWEDELQCGFGVAEHVVKSLFTGYVP